MTRRIEQKSKIRKRRVSRGPQNAKEYYGKSKRFRDTWNRVTHVISRMRADHISLRSASKEFGLSPETVKRWGGPALQKRTNGEYAARKTDRLLRVLVIPTAIGLQEVVVTDSHDAS